MYMLNLLHVTRGVLPPSIYGRPCSMDGETIHGFIHKSRSAFPKRLFPPFSSPRPLFQDYWRTHPWIFHPTCESSSTRQVTGSTSDRKHPWMGISPIPESRATDT